MPKRILLLAGLGLAAAAASLAHHSEPLYDMKHPVTVAGVVTRVEWSNPHAYLYLVITGEKSAAEEWTVELPAPHTLQRSGWTSVSVKPGDRIACTGGRARSSARALRAVAVELPGGKKLKTEK